MKTRHRLLLIGSLLPVAIAAAQNNSNLAELTKLHANLNKPGTIVTPDQARMASGRLDEWKLDAAALSGGSKRELLAVQVLIAAAMGDAAKAGQAAALLQPAAEGDRLALEATYCGACAAGDAQTAEAAVKALAEKAEGEAKRAQMRRRSWLAQVGREAPDISISTDDVKEFKPRKRGDKILIIDFWNTLAEPPKEHVAALKKLYEELSGDSNVEFIGVNAEAESRLEKAKDYARKNGFAWPQRYEGVALKAPVTHEAFKAGQSPWTVLIDSYGYQRAVGSPTEPAFQYAVRAALAEARADFSPVLPKTTDGKQAKRESQEPTKENAKKKDDGAAKDLPSNLEAKKLLQEAHAMRKTGMKTKAREMYQRVISEYPGTKEAEEAQFWLE